jgi:hypothetical protein
MFDDRNDRTVLPSDVLSIMGTYPNEIRLVIDCLTEGDLNVVAQLNKNWKALAEPWLINCYRQNLSDTPLRGFLSNIAAEVPGPQLSDYFNFAEALKQNCIIDYLQYLYDDNQPFSYSSWPSLWKSFQDLQPPPLSHLAGVSVQSVSDQARWLMNQFEKYSEIIRPQPSRELSKTDNDQLRLMWRTCQKLEAIFANTVLYIKLVHAIIGRIGKQSVDVLLNSFSNRWLKGSDLIQLDRSLLKGVLTQIMQRALDLSKINDPSVRQEQLKIQELLKRLTEKDLLDYLRGEYVEITKQRREIFLQAIQNNYLPLLQKFTDAVLMKMVIDGYDYEYFLSSYDYEAIVSIVSHPLLMKQLSSEHLFIDLLGRLNTEQFDKVIKQNKAYLTFESALSLSCTDHLFFLLTKADFLHSLTPDQLIELTHYVTREKFEKFIDSAAFCEYIARLDPISTEENQPMEGQLEILQNNQSSYPSINYPVNQFLIKLARSSDLDRSTVIEKIARVSLNKSFEYKELSFNFDRATVIATHLALHDEVILRLHKAGRLIDMITTANWNLTVVENVACRYLHILSIEELRELLSYSQIFPKLNLNNWLACQNQLSDTQCLILAGSLNGFSCNRWTDVIKEQYSERLAWAATSYLKRIEAGTITIAQEKLGLYEIDQLQQQFGEIPAIQSLIQTLTKNIVVGPQTIEIKRFIELREIMTANSATEESSKDSSDDEVDSTENEIESREKEKQFDFFGISIVNSQTVQAIVDSDINQVATIDDTLGKSQKFCNNQPYPSETEEPGLDIREKIKLAVVTYLEWMKIYAIGTRGVTRFSHWYHGESGRKRASELLAITKDVNQDLRGIQEALAKAFRASSIHKHSLSRYLLAEFGQGISSVQNLTDKEFANLKNSFDITLASTTRCITP